MRTASRIAIHSVRAVIGAAILVLGLVGFSPSASAYPACAQGDSNCCPQSSCPAIDQDFIQKMMNVGIASDPVKQSIPGLLSGARNTVCPRLAQGIPASRIMSDLQYYSGFTPQQAIVYVNEAVSHYCSNQYENLLRN